MSLSPAIKAWHPTVLAATIAWMALPASASLSVYTDQASFLAATGPVQTTTFNAYTAPDENKQWISLVVTMPSGDQQIGVNVLPPYSVERTQTGKSRRVIDQRPRD